MMFIEKLSELELVILCYDEYPKVYQQFSKKTTHIERIELLKRYKAMSIDFDTLLNLLLGCENIIDNDSRDALIKDLPADIHRGIRRSKSLGVDVRNIIRACLAYPNGVTALVNCLEDYEGQSLALIEIKKYLGIDK